MISRGPYFSAVVRDVEEGSDEAIHHFWFMDCFAELSSGVRATR